jgi:hypothetical protein
MYDNQRYEPDPTVCWHGHTTTPCDGPLRWTGVHPALAHERLPTCNAHAKEMEDLQPYVAADVGTLRPGRSKE